MVMINIWSNNNVNMITFKVYTYKYKHIML